MDFKQLNNDDAKIAAALLKYLGLTEDDVSDSEPSTWDDHEEAVEAAEATNSSQPDLSPKEKLKAIVAQTIDDIYEGYLQIESASELVDTIRAAEWLDED